VKQTGEEKKVQQIAYDIPASLHKALSESAQKNKWTMKKELTSALEEYLNGSFIKLDPFIKKAVALYAEENDFTMTEAVNFLVASKISVIEEVGDIIKAKANKDYEASLAAEMDEAINNAYFEENQKSKKEAAS